MKTGSQRLRRIARGAERFLGAVASYSHRRPYLALGIVVAVAAVSWVGARNLQLDSDLTALLPKSFPSIRDLKALSKRFGGVGWMVVVGEDAPPDQLRRFADDVAPKLAALPHVRYVDYKRPAKFFEKRALYFLPPKALRALNHRLQARIRWEQAQHNPLYINLDSSAPPPLDLADITKTMHAGAGGGGSRWLAAQMGKTYYIDPQRRMIALLAKPSSQSIDLAFSQTLVSEVQHFVDHLDLKKYGPHMRVELTGRYKNRVDLQRMLTHDLEVASVVAAILVLLYLLLHFRRLLAVALVLVPLGVGLVWTFGFTALVFGHLNILTGFVGAIMLGLGIDHGIHLLGRYEVETSAGHDEATAVRNTFGQTGRAVIVAAATTMVGFASLAVSEFRAFRDFGIVAAAGMVLTVLAYTVTLPALLSLARRFGWRPRALPPASRGLLPRWVHVWAPQVVLVSVLVAVAALWSLPRARFNYDFSSLAASNLPSFVLNQEVNHILGYTFVPVALLTNSLSEERYVSQRLRADQRAKGSSSTIAMVASSADLVPQHQAEKLPLIRAIGKTIHGIKADWIRDPTVRKQLVALQQMVRAQPFSRDDLPTQLKLLFRGTGGTGGEGFVLVFPAISLNDGKAIVRYAKEVRSVRQRDGARVPAAGEDLILADILTMVTHEAPTVLTLSFVAIVLTLILLLGSVREGLLCLLPAVLGLLITLGILPSVGLEVNYLNMVMIPVLFGMGVDGGAHITTHLAAGESVEDALEHTRRGIWGAIVTTMLGFGTLLLAHHKGLNSLGELAVIGLAANLVASLVVLPAWLIWWRDRAERRAIRALQHEHQRRLVG